VAMKTSRVGVDLIKKFEGLHKVMQDGRIRSYRCPAGRWTIGYGHTKGVRSGMHITKEQADQFLLEDLQEYEKAVSDHVEVPLSQAQFDALVSFAFNVGVGAFRTSTLLKRLNAGRFEDIPEQLMRWNKATVDGVKTVLPGLTRRRAAEAALFTMDMPFPSDDGKPLPQKNIANAPKPLTKSRTMWGAFAATLGTILAEVSAQLHPLAAYGPVLENAFLVVTILGIALVAYARWTDHKDGER